MQWHVPRASFLDGLNRSDTPFFKGFEHGTASVELFAPVGADTQTPHAQDELYIVHTGTSAFIKAGERVDVGAGDVLFVEAGVEHRFADFSDDFSTWVIFWGPDGGERDNAD